MDVLKRLQIEFPGISSTISDYSSGIIMNHIQQLGIAIDEMNIEVINYCLSEIDDWYQNNMDLIRKNSFVHNLSDHEKNKKLISEMKKEFLNYSFSNETMKQSTTPLLPLIFLSHSSSDKIYGNALQKFFTGIGIKNNQLIYTSHPLHKIPLDANIYDYLRMNIDTKILMIFLWSDVYLDSPACLNEMGAAWVMKSDYTNLFIPTFHFDNSKFHECAVDTRRMGAVLNGDEHCKANMLELKNKVQVMFGLANDEANSTFVLDRFIKEIKEITNHAK